MSADLKGRTALITGGSRGIGLSIAEEMLRSGARVIITARKQPGLDHAVNHLRHLAPDDALRAVPCHAGHVDALDALCTSLNEAGWAPDVLVANAAANPYFGPLIHAEEAAFEKTFQVNVKGPMWLANRVARDLMARRASGSILFTSSILGMRASPGQGLYGMTKAALVSLAQTLAVELGPRNIRVNCISPGLIETKFASALTDDETIRAGFERRTALGRIGQPHEIGRLAAWLSSDAASYVTGQNIVADGGYTSS